MQHFQAIGQDEMEQRIGLHIPDITPLGLLFMGLRKRQNLSQ
jgi:hypothetical protein